MLTYTPPSHPELPKPTEKPWLLLLLCFIWLWPGILGHGPWKPDEPYAVGVVQWMLHSGDWLTPRIAGEPYLDTPPLYYWVAALFARAFSPWLLPLHDAARLATPLFMSLTLLFVGMTARELIGRRHGRSAVLILIGCLGLIDTGHQLSADVAILCAEAACLLGLTLALRRGFLGALALALGSAALMLSASLVELVLLWMTAAMLPAFRGWRSRQYVKTITIALALGAPLVLMWPMSMAKHQPELFAQWWHSLALGPFYGFGRFALLHDFGYYLRLLPWFAWPAWPLAAWAVWRGRERLSSTRYQLPLVLVLMNLLMLMLSPRQNPVYALPLLLPLAVLAAVELDTLKRGAAAFFNWFGIFTLGLAGVLVWLGWTAMNFGWPAKLAAKAVKYSPSYEAQIHVLPLLLALAMSLAWGWAVTRRRLMGRQAVTNWALGMTLLWSLAGTLWLPWLDAQKGYHMVMHSLRASLPAQLDSCVASAPGNQLPRAMAYYYVNLPLLNSETVQGHSCRYRLISTPEANYQPEGPWKMLWRGARPAEKREFYVLLKRQD